MSFQKEPIYTCCKLQIGIKKLTKAKVKIVMTLLQITSTSNVTEDSTTVQTSSLPNQAQKLDDFIQYDIDLSSHAYNNNVTFQVSYTKSNLLSILLPKTIFYRYKLCYPVEN